MSAAFKKDGMNTRESFANWLYDLIQREFDKIDNEEANMTGVDADLNLADPTITIDGPLGHFVVEVQEL